MDETQRGESIGMFIWFAILLSRELAVPMKGTSPFSTHDDPDPLSSTLLIRSSVAY